MPVERETPSRAPERPAPAARQRAPLAAVAVARLVSNHALARLLQRAPDEDAPAVADALYHPLELERQKVLVAQPHEEKKIVFEEDTPAELTPEKPEKEEKKQPEPRQKKSPTRAPQKGGQANKGGSKEIPKPALATQAELAKALTILRVAEAMKFYEPVKELAGSGKVLNPEGLAVLVGEFHAKAREKPKKPKEGEKAEPDEGAGAGGLVRELLFALDAARLGKHVQLGAWKPDFLQTGMAERGKKDEALQGTLVKLEKEGLPLGMGWGGDVVVWDLRPERKGPLATTVQHKVLSSDKPDAFDRELLKAVTQLAGQNTEKAVLGGHSVADLVVMHEKNPLQDLDGEGWRDLVQTVLLKHSYARKLLVYHVDEVRVATRKGEWTFRCADGKVIKSDEKLDPTIAGQIATRTPTSASAIREPAQHSAETLDYEAAIKVRGEHVTKNTPKPSPPLDAIKIRSDFEKKWKKDDSEATLANDEAKLNAFRDDKKKYDLAIADIDAFKKKNDSTKKDLEAKWAEIPENKEKAASISNYETAQAADALLAKRRNDDPDWKALREKRSARFSAVRHRVRLKIAQSAVEDDTVVETSMNEWLDAPVQESETSNREDAKEIARLEKVCAAKPWVLDSDPKPIAEAIRAIIAKEDKPDYLGESDSPERAKAKRERGKEREAGGKLQQERHALLFSVLQGAKIPAETGKQIFEQIGAVKQREGNARAVAKIVDDLAAALGAAWKQTEPQGPQRDLLDEATTSLAKVNSGIRYQSLLAEVNELNNVRAQATESGPMIGQWYALSCPSGGTWTAADQEARTQRNESTAQEVDVSYVLGGKIHFSEVGVDIYTLEGKLTGEKKSKQRESYLKLKQRPDFGSISYAIDSATDWEKIFFLGTATPGMQAPVVKYLVENDLVLKVGGKPYREGDLKSAWEQHRPTKV